FRLPGDIVIDRPGFKFFFPITTMLLIGAVISILALALRRYIGHRRAPHRPRGSAVTGDKRSASVALVRGLPLADEYPLENHAMHALADVDDLGHSTVPHDRGERIRLLAAHRDDLLCCEPMDGLLDGDLHRLIQILVVTHEDPVALRFRPGPIRFQVLAH